MASSLSPHVGVSRVDPAVDRLGLRSASEAGPAAVVRAVAMCNGAVRPEDLPERIRDYRPDAVAAAATPSAPAPAEEEWLPLAEIESRYVGRVLAHTGGNKQAAARLLGVDRKTIERMIKRHALAPPPAE